jgi:hypothetical protein
MSSIGARGEVDRAAATAQRMPLAGTTDLSAKVAELEARLAKLEGVLRVGTAGDVTLKAPITMSIESGASLQVKCGAMTTIESGAMMQLKSGMIKLN